MQLLHCSCIAEAVYLQLQLLQRRINNSNSALSQTFTNTTLD